MFWAMTPRQFNYLVERYRERLRREDRRAGEIIAILFNINRDSKAMPDGIEWQDVFPEWKEKPKHQTEEQMLATLKLWAIATNRMGEA